MNGFAQLPKIAIPLLVFSLVSNLAVLISPIFMMQVLDRVIPSGNISTLFLLGGLACAALLVQAVVEAARDLSLGRLARWSEAAGAELALAPGETERQEVIAEAASVSQFLGGGLAPIALSVPWIPVFFFALLLLHPGFAVLIVLLVLASAAVKYASDLLTSADLAQAGLQGQKEQQCLNNASQFSSRVGVGVIAQNLHKRFADHQIEKHGFQDRSALTLSWAGAGGGFIRSLAQIAALALGAFLVTIGSLSAGGMIAASIILAKAFGTCESALNQSARIRQALRDLRSLASRDAPAQASALEQPNLSGTMRVETLTFPRGGGRPPRLDRISFEIDAGECLAIVGSSGSGKSTLIKALAGNETAPIGSVFLDNSEVRSLTDGELFRHTGVLAQQAELLPGTIAENIACFSPDAETDQIIDAARTAGVHGLISALPNAYNTDLTTDMAQLSLGQRQRLALARALYTRPRYLFLDEPNALMDADAERTLVRTLQFLKEKGVTIIMVLQRSGIMLLADKVIRLDNGRCVDFGNRSEVLGRMTINRHQIELPLLRSSISDLRDWIATRFTRTSDAGFSQKAQLVGAELFSVALENGDQDRARTAQFTFAFKDDHHCELKMAEEGAIVAEGKVKKVREFVANPKSKMQSLSKEEQSLALVDQISESFEVSNVENFALYSVALADQVNLMAGHN